MTNYVPHLAAGDVWVFLLSMIALIVVSCLYQIKSERKNETNRITIRRPRSRVRHNGTHDL
jgi:predicted membrane channel-forming protein YqfA (hemolysin III family)